MGKVTEKGVYNVMEGELVARSTALKTSETDVNKRRSILQDACFQTDQMGHLISEIEALTDLRKAISRRKTSAFDKAAVAKYKLLHENYKLTTDRRLSLINKILADDTKVAVVENDKGLPQLTLTIVNR